MSLLGYLRTMALLLAAIIAGVYGVIIADGHNHLADVSRDGRNSLDRESIAVLAQLPGPIDVAAILPPTNPAARAIEEVFARYRRHHPALTLRFVDPRADLAAAEELGANLGEIVLAYDGRRERLSRLDEITVTSGLARLARGADRYVTVLAANGERQVARQANRDLSLFADLLGKRGLEVREFRFGQVSAIPDNTAVLVIASPTVSYSLGELESIERHVTAGGNLLWLAEPDQPPGLAGLARSLGVEFLPGTIVDPLGLTKFKENGNPAYALSVERPLHPALGDFTQTVVFPFAAALVAMPNVGWKAEPLATTEPAAWTETGPFEGNVGFDAADEIQGALTLALALTRPREDGSTQRVIVVGDGDFLSNTFVDSLGNREFGRRVIEWLAADEALVDIALEPVADGLLDLEMWQRLLVFLVFGVLLPVGFLANGALIAWRRRHA